MVVLLHTFAKQVCVSNATAALRQFLPPPERVRTLAGPLPASTTSTPSSGFSRPCAQPMMQPQQVVNLLTATFSDDNSRRQQAEKALKKLGLQHGFCQTLLQIIRTEAVPIDIRKSAAVYLKNQSKARRACENAVSKSYWSFLSEAERQSVKSNIIQATVSAHPSVRRIMEDTVANIAFHEFPATWPQLADELLACIKSQKQPIMEAALHTLVQVTKKFKYVVIQR